ncbi:MAG: hypothetical protein RLZZ387_134 [Chloroflexota bacterium]
MSTTPRLPRSAPEAHGIPSNAIRAFVEAASANTPHIHSLMLVRHGSVVAEGWRAPYAPELPHVLFSLSKSFASTAVGLAVADGLLTVDDRVLPFFPEEAPAEVGEHLAAMRVRDLLSMATGHDVDTTPALWAATDGNWARAFLAQPVEHAPGTHFVYNSGATYMLAAIIERLTGQSLLAYLEPRLLAPLGIVGATWERCPRGVCIGGWGLSIRTEDIACFGQMYLQQGVWQGRQLVPAAWVAEATAKQVSNGSSPESDWAQGYGYQFWRCRHEAYRGDGAFGQFCVVMPEQDAVLAITSGVEDMQAVLNLVWAHLLPAMADGPLPEDPAAEAELRQTLGGLAMPLAEGAASSPTAARVSGRVYRFDANEAGVEALSVVFDEGGAALTVRDARGEHHLAIGAGGRRLGVTTLDKRGALKVAASGAWGNADTYVAELCYYETPFCPTLTLHFAGDEVAAVYRQNVSFTLDAPETLVGRSVR